MKNYLFVCLLVWGLLAPAQQIELGEKVPDVDIALIGEKAESLSLASLQGKVVLLDFWATWCRPCVASMPHLDSLQAAFEGKFQVVAVSKEAEDRLERFKGHTNYRFLFGRDTTGTLKALFPHAGIPHSVLIDMEGKVVAITNPKHITAVAIQSVLNHKAIDLPLKRDNMNYDLGENYFDPNLTSREAFDLLPYDPDLPTYSSTYSSGPFANRKLVMHNMAIEGLYRYAYQTSAYRTVLECEPELVKWEYEQNRFNMRLIVDQPEELYPVFKEKLASNFSIQARLEKRVQQVLVLESIDSEKIQANPAEHHPQYEGRGDGFRSEGATLEDFRSYLEGFGIVGYAVVNETGIEGAYEMDFSFDPENSATFKEAIAELGLKYSLQEREVEVLVLYEEE